MSEENKITAAIRFEYYGVETEPILEIETTDGFNSKDLYIDAEVEILDKEYRVKNILIQLLQKTSVREYDIFITVYLEDVN
jgi:hypothetical protein